MMKKISAGLSALAVAGTMMLSSATPASAAWWNWHHHHHHGISVPGAVIGGVIGFGIAAAVADSLSDRWGDRWEDHYRRCEARYQSYDWRTDTYVANRSGVRRLCRL